MVIFSNYGDPTKTQWVKTKSK